MRTSSVRGRMEEEAATKGGWGATNRHRAAAAQATCLQGRVLDVGCGSDGYLRKLSANGVSCFGADVRNVQIDFPFVQALAERLPFRDKSFETVLLFEVLEHIEDPLSALRELRRISRTLVLSVPNCELRDSFARAGLAPFHYTDRTHVNFFTSQSLTELLIEAGWTPGEVTGFGGMSPAVLTLEWAGLPVHKIPGLGAALRRIPGRPKMSLLATAS